MNEQQRARTRRLGAAALCLATVCTGLMAGVVLAYAIAVMPGLERTGDRPFVEAFQHMDHALDGQLWFWMAIFLGSMAFTILSLVLTVRLSIKTTRAWLVAAAVLYAATIAITGLGIDPLENEFGSADDAGAVVDPPSARAELDEDGWVLLNNVRLATSTGAFACLAWSLVLFGRSASRSDQAGSHRIDVGLL